MKENDHKPKCFHVVERTVIPGIPSFEDGQLVTKTNLYVVVEGQAERYFANSGTVYLSTSHMRPQEFWSNEKHANDFACAMHRKIGCESPECGWTQRKPIEDDILPF